MSYLTAGGGRPLQPQPVVGADTRLRLDDVRGIPAHLGSWQRLIGAMGQMGARRPYLAKRFMMDTAGHSVDVSRVSYGDLIEGLLGTFESSFYAGGGFRGNLGSVLGIVERESSVCESATVVGRTGALSVLGMWLSVQTDTHTLT